MVDIQINTPRAVTVAVVIVSYASDHVLSSCIQALDMQIRPADVVVVVDNKSPDATYLGKLPPCSNLTIVRSNRNLGFCGGNNLGYQSVINNDYVLFLNPDAFLDKHFIRNALEYMQEHEQSDVGILTGTLLGYDINQNRATGLIDSVGIDHTWYGRWYDISQGLPMTTLKESIPHEVTAVCGALMFCRNSALKNTLLRNREVFDEKFFMYKEDIDLCLRLQKQGWRIIHHPGMQSQHCRGWQSRSKMTARAKLLSARNELTVNRRYLKSGYVYSALKYLFVLLIETRAERRY